MAKTNAIDFLFIGAGVIGLNLARELKKKFPDSNIMVFEKENLLGAHSSGRNSGVIHAGFYYSADSLKAKFTREGNEQLREYCLEKKIPVNMCGKLVVTQNEREEKTLDELIKRGVHNGVSLDMITAEEAKKIEPRVKTLRRAIWSPNTGCVNPISVLKKLLEDAMCEGIQFRFGAKFLRIKSENTNTITVTTTAGDVETRFVVNCAGLYADKVAREFGCSRDYRILPFKGLYLYSDEKPGSLKTNIYPVPDMAYPFLGVHFTLTSDGKIKVGPTAIPAFWREQYSITENFNFEEMVEILWRELGLLVKSDIGFRNLAFKEIQKMSKNKMVNLASALATDVNPSQYTKWGKPGIRAQLYNIKTNKLEMDFKYEGNSRSFHVLNAVSPAFTASMPLAKFLAERINVLLQNSRGAGIVGEQIREAPHRPPNKETSL